MTALVCFTMDNLSDAADLGRGHIDKPRPPGSRPFLEVGFPAMLDLYERHGIKITHFLEGWNGEAHPEIVEDIVKRGHRIGMHGWQHEHWSELEADRAYDLALRATEALEKAAGIRPLAFRAPGGKRGAGTAGMLNELGYQIDASLGEDGKEGGEVKLLSETLWTVPYVRDAIDATHWLWKDEAPAKVEECWHHLLNQAVAENHFLVFIWHPHVMGVDAERRKVGESILERVTNSEEFKVLSLEDLVVHYSDTNY